MADASRSAGAKLPPPAPGTEAADDPAIGPTAGGSATDPADAEAIDPARSHASRRSPRPGQLTAAWRVMLIITWIAVFVAYLAVWKASVEIGLATWWRGPRSNPQPVSVQLVPFYAIAAFGILASYNVRRLPAIGVLGAIVLAAIAIPDISRSAGLAVVEFAIAGAVLVVSLAASTGTYRRAGVDTARDPAHHTANHTANDTAPDPAPDSTGTAAGARRR